MIRRTLYRKVIVLMAIMNCFLSFAQTWKDISPSVSGLNDDVFYSIYFVDTNIGYVCGSGGRLYKTINAGSSWSEISLSSSFRNIVFKSIHFIDKSTGFIVGTKGTILKTTNGGVSWYPFDIKVPTIGERDLTDVHVIDANSIWLTGSCGFVGHYFNGAFSPVGSLKENLEQIHVTATEAWAVGTQGGFYRIHLTQHNATRLSGSSHAHLFGIAQNAVKPPLVIGMADTLYVSDGSKKPFPQLKWSRAIFNVGNIFFVAGEKGKVQRFEDLGTNWKDISIPNGSNIKSMYFVNDNVGYVCGTNGKVYKYDGTYIPPPPPLLTCSANVTKSISCFNGNDGSVRLIANGGVSPHSYEFKSGNTLISTSSSISGLSAGTYNYKISSANNVNSCSGSITLSSVLKINVTHSSIVSENNTTKGSITLNNPTGGNGGYSYKWSNMATTRDIINLNAGTYDLTITDSKSCSEKFSFIVPRDTSNNAPPLTCNNIVTRNSDCYGANTGSIRITPSGGSPAYKFSIKGPNNFTSSLGDLTNLYAGNYQYTVTDSKSSICSGSIALSEPTRIQIQVDSIYCSNKMASTGAIGVSISGGIPKYSYKWTSSNGLVSSSEDLLNVPSGNYSLEVIDRNLCTKKSNSLFISECSNGGIGGEKNWEISYSTSVTSSNYELRCAGDCNASIQVIIINGSGNFRYNWSHDPSINNASVTNLCANTYKLTITDITKKKDTIISFPIRAPQELQIKIASLDCASNNIAKDGSCIVDVMGGISPYDYFWSDGQKFSSSHNSLQGGMHELLVKDKLNCEQKLKFTICVDGEMKDIELPDLITPNGDAKNDFFIIPQIESGQWRQVELIISDRNGHVVFRSIPYSNNWNGVNNSGEALRSGTYYYILRSNGEELTKGLITILH